MGRKVGRKYNIVGLFGKKRFKVNLLYTAYYGCAFIKAQLVLGFGVACNGNGRKPRKRQAMCKRTVAHGNAAVFGNISIIILIVLKLFVN